MGCGSYRGWYVASPAYRWPRGTIPGAGDLCSTANDLLTLLRAHLAGFPLANVLAETRRTRLRVEGRPDIGIIAIGRFSSRTHDEFRRAYQELVGKGVTQVILDLRDDSGGLLDASIAVAGEFLDGGVVAFERRRNGGEHEFPAAGRGLAAGIPMAVLVNHGTASAAEIVAGALMDRNRAPLIGEKTYGKGSVQLVFDLPDGSSVHVTAARWYTPLHTPIDGVGLTPTIQTSPRDGPKDPPLDRAVEYLTNGA